MAKFSLETLDAYAKKISNKQANMLYEAVNNKTYSKQYVDIAPTFVAYLTNGELTRNGITRADITNNVSKPLHVNEHAHKNGVSVTARSEKKFNAILEKLEFLGVDAKTISNIREAQLD